MPPARTAVLGLGGAVVVIVDTGMDTGLSLVVRVVRVRGDRLRDGSWRKLSSV